MNIPLIIILFIILVILILLIIIFPEDFHDLYKLQEIDKGDKRYYVYIKREPEKNTYIPNFENEKDARDYINNLKD